MLSRADGNTTYEQLCAVTGLGADATIEILRRLKRDGLILGDPDGRSLLERLDDGSPVDPALLLQGPDLSPELKTRLLRLVRRLPKLTPQQLLGLPADSDLGRAKRAYFMASKELHPDRFYGKDLGPFREILGEIFTHLTRAWQQIQGDAGAAAQK